MTKIIAITLKLLNGMRHEKELKTKTTELRKKTRVNVHYLALH